MNRATKEYSVTLPLVYSNESDGSMTLLQTEGSAVVCSTKHTVKTAVWSVLPEGVDDLPDSDGGDGNSFIYRMTSTVPAIGLVCGCGENHEYNEVSGICDEIQPFWNATRIALLVTGCIAIALGLAAYYTIPRWRRKQQAYKADLHLQQMLLDETQGEIAILKNAWEIAENEITLSSRLAEGAFGVVWKGYWGDTKVAIKILKSGMSMGQLDDSMVLEFEREVEFMQRTRHPNIVRFFGAGTQHDGTQFLVEELLWGSLRSLLKDCVSGTQTLSFNMSRDIAVDVCKGMAHIHSLGHIHRDIKSGNVLLTRQRQAKIADFGSVGQILANGMQNGSKKNMRKDRDANSSSSSSSSSLLPTDFPINAPHQTTAVGTPLYMSLEVIAGQPYDSSTDVWSFGVLLWEMFAKS
eukprot:UC1_evm1s271